MVLPFASKSGPNISCQTPMGNIQKAYNCHCYTPMVIRASPALGLILTLWATPVLAESVLYRGVFGEPESLDPDRSGVTSEIAIVNDLFVGLSSYDIAGQVTQGLAESWQVSDDGLTWRFKLRPGLRWSDGEPLTADDFVFSFRRAVTPATAATMADRLFMLRNAQKILNGNSAPETLGVSAPADDEVLLELEHPAPQLPLLLANGIGFPLPRHAIERQIDHWNRPGQMVSNGAYVLAERRPNEFVRLVKNPHFYAAQQTRIDTLIYLPSDNVDTQLNRFRAGELHINGNPGFPGQRQAWLKEELGDAVQVAPYLLVVFLRFNFRRQPFDNLAVRRALSLAIDRYKIAHLVLGGGEQPAYNVVPPAVSRYQPAASPLVEGDFAARLAVAKELMAAEGYSQSQPLRLSLRYPTGWAREVCIAIAAMWRDIGVRASLDNSEIKSMIVDVRRGDFDVAYTGALHDDDPEQFLDRLRPDGSYNTGNYQSAAFAAALASAKLEPDPKQRRQRLRQAETILLGDFPVVPLVYGVSRSLVAPTVRGWHANPVDIHLSRYLWLAEDGVEAR